jgi:hypothetical protein
MRNNNLKGFIWRGSIPIQNYLPKLGVFDVIMIIVFDMRRSVGRIALQVDVVGEERAESATQQHGRLLAGIRVTFDTY